MVIDPGPYDMDDHRVVLEPAGAAVPRPVTPDFYAALDREFGDFSGHLLVSRHAFEAAWPTWEMHPAGDEVVYLLSGDVDFVLWEGGRERVVRVSEPGTYVIVPKATWHTARPRVPTILLFLTPGEGTRNAEAPEPG